MANIDSVKLPDGSVYNMQDVVSPRGSNDNLMHNTWFTVNQKGFTSGTPAADTKFMDRYKVLSHGTLTFTLSNNQLTIAKSSTGSGTNAMLFQAFESGRVDYDTVYTFSMLTSSGDIFTHTGKFMADVSGVTTHTIAGFEVMMGTVTESGQMGVCLYFSNSSNGSITIKAFKLEKGSTSTLALDAPPDYSTELLKCQRYFYRIKADANNSYIGMGSVFDSAEGNAVIKLPTAMRTTATLTYAGTVNVFEKGTPHSVNQLVLLHRTMDMVCIAFKTSGLTAGCACMLYLANSGDYIDFDSEL